MGIGFQISEWSDCGLILGDKRERVKGLIYGRDGGLICRSYKGINGDYKWLWGLGVMERRLGERLWSLEFEKGNKWGGFH